MNKHFLYVQQWKLLINTFFIILHFSFANTLTAQKLWSDPTTWGGTKPIAGQAVVIPMGDTILLDETPPDLAGLTIHGVLEFEAKDLALTADWIMVMGTLRIGSEAVPFTHQAIITLKGANQNENIMGMGTRGIMVMGGNLELHGTPPTIPWTKINAHAPANSTALTLKDTVNWKVNDEIVIGPTDYFRAGNGASRTQTAVLTSVQNDQLSLDVPLNAFRWGLLQYATNTGMSLTPTNIVTPPSDTAFTPTILDERAPIGNLTRNIRIQAPEDTLWTNHIFGCHIMIMRDSMGIGKIGTAHVNGVEIRRGGQHGRLGRYPFHWHMLSYHDTLTLSDATGQYIKNSVINFSGNRGIVIHGTNGVRVDTNIVYRTLGHSIFTEDASEMRNIIDGNMVLGAENPLIPLKMHETGGRGAAGFWVSNPNNTIINNLAADCRSNGFWLAFPRRTWGLSSRINLRPAAIRFGVFDNNITHSNRKEGLFIDGVEIDSLGNTRGNLYFSTVDWQEPDYSTYSTVRRFYLTRYKTWKNGGEGIWDRAVVSTNYEVVSADNCGRFFAGSGAEGIIERCLVVGTSLNHLMNGTDRPNKVDFNGDQRPAAFATYHSAFSIRSNIAINFSMHNNARSGVFSTEDYYFRPVEKGQFKNYNNLIINSHPGVRLPAVYPYFSLSGAIWDPHQTWGGPTDEYYYVYDSTFFTHGQTPLPVVGGSNAGGVLVKGPFYGFYEFIINNGNQRTNDLMAMRATRLDPNFNPVDTFELITAQSNWALGHMRDFAAHPDGYYQLEFPSIDIVTDVGLSIENMLTTDDTLVIAIEYDGSYDIEQVYTSSYFLYYDPSHTASASSIYKHRYTAVNSRAEVINFNGGEAYWQDKANNLVWIKITGGIAQLWNDNDFEPWDTERLYRKFYLRLYGQPIVALPIDLASFSVTAQDNQMVRLDWTTYSETNNDYFTIERSNNGIDWAAIAQVQGAGTSVTPLQYSSIDEMPFLGTSYYRLKQTDYNGQFSYSDIKKVIIEMNGVHSVSMYPNPTSSYITLNLNQLSSKTTITIINTKGQILHNKSVENTQNIVVNTADLANGLYFVEVKTTGGVAILKLVKK